MKHLWILNVDVNVFAARLAVHGYSSCETFIGICIQGRIQDFVQGGSIILRAR